MKEFVLSIGLLNRQNGQSDGRIPLVLTYHPALNKVYDILRDSSNVLLVDQKHKELFQNKVFLSFRRAKNLKDLLVRAKLSEVDGGVCRLVAVINAMAGNVVRFVA